MLVRNCAGGIVFKNDSVLLLQNDKSEWIFPKGVLRHGGKTKDIALESVKRESGVSAETLGSFGRTSYEFFSASRQKPVRNIVVWYIMVAKEGEVTPNISQGFSKGGFFPFYEALEMVTYSQDKSLLLTGYQRYKELIH